VTRQFYLFFAYGYQKTAELYADFKSVEKIEKVALKKVIHQGSLGVLFAQNR
jgi:hypothetical protein